MEDGTVGRRTRDFTLEKYGELCTALLFFGYTPTTVQDYLTKGGSNKVGVLRHDVDRKPQNALKMAELEHSLGIRSTYYFRYPYTFVPDVITRVASLEHEVGYHYEVLSKARGDRDQAMALFTKELEELRKIAEIRTMCMHGSPMSRYDNRDLWRDDDYEQLGLVGDAFLSMEGKGLRYLTDTGRDWSGKRSLRDAMPDSEPVPVRTTDELIAWIGTTDAGLYLTAHPERWAMGTREWVGSRISDTVFNIGKKVLTVVR